MEDFLNERLAKMVVRPDGTLLEGLQAINEGRCGIAFVCDAAGRVVGTVADGDIRRALLAGKTLDSHCLKSTMRSDFVAVDQSPSRAEVLDLMRARQIAQVPVLDAEGHLIGLHLMRELIGNGERRNWALILAGGKGTRLRPLTETTPKPMITVAGRPILERLVLHLVGWGVRRIFLSVNHLAKVIEDGLATNTRRSRPAPDSNGCSARLADAELLAAHRENRREDVQRESVHWRWRAYLGLNRGPEPKAGGRPRQRAAQ